MLNWKDYLVAAAEGIFCIGLPCGAFVALMLWFLKCHLERLV